MVWKHKYVRSFIYLFLAIITHELISRVEIWLNVPNNGMSVDKLLDDKLN